MAKWKPKYKEWYYTPIYDAVTKTFYDYIQWDNDDIDNWLFENNFVYKGNSA